MHPDKLTKAINALIIHAAFYASMLLKQRIEAVDHGTFSVDGTTLRYNPEFLNTLSFDETKGVLVHEMEHLCKFHHARQKGRDHETWNRACDYAINPLVIKAGYALPKDCLFAPEFDGMNAETIYRKLQQDPQSDKAKRPFNDFGSMGEPEDEQGEQIPEHAAEEKTAVQVAQAIATAKQRGQLPGHMEASLANVPPRVDAKELLARFLSEQAKNDYSFLRPNKRFIGQGIVLPSMHSVTFGKVVFAVDTSGSVSETELNQFAADLREIMATYAAEGQSPEIIVIWCDAAVQGVDELTESELIKPKGRGGTDFAPVFNYIAEHGEIDPVALVYLTDGYGPCQCVEPAFPVLWCLTTANNSFRPPFGEVVMLWND